MLKIQKNIFAGAVLCALLSLSACKTPRDVVYFQDVTAPTSVVLEAKQIRIKPLDKLNIFVNARDPQVTDGLNLPFVSRYFGQGGTNSASSQGVVAYTVSETGYVNMPYVGKVHIAGLTVTEAADVIKNKIETLDLAIEPVVTINLVNAQVAVLGEVAKPGRYQIDSEDMTILDMLGAAGDLTIYGERSNIKVLRRNGDKQDTYIVNLLSEKDLLNSPVYYVQQDDVIYVEPNPTRIRQSTLNANTVLSTSFWISLASVVITVVALIIR